MKILAGGIVAVVVLMAIIMGLIQLNAGPVAAAIDCDSVCAEQCGGVSVDGAPPDRCRCKKGTCDPNILYCY